MEQKELTQIVEKEKVIAIVRGVEPGKCIKTAEALYAGGIRMMEITFDAKAPEKDQTVASCISSIIEYFDGKMLVGTGTVLTTQQVELTARAGGCYIISPNVNVDVIHRTKELGMLSMPGALTPTEIESAHEAGADFVKLFPIASLGSAYVKAMRAPLPHIKMLAVGGVTEKNFEEFLKAGVCGAGVGGNLANKAWIEAGEYYKITEVAKQLTEIAERY